MKVIFNTRCPESPASIFYRQGFSYSENVSYSDWDSYEKYAVALFMAFPEDLKEIAAAKKQNPGIRVGVIDPRNDRIQEYISDIDFIVLDSIEMKDYFSYLNRPMYIYFEYQNLKQVEKRHSPKDITIIGYHGNKVHLASMYPHLTHALEALGEKYRIELHVMYNVEKLGQWRLGVPEGVVGVEGG